MPRWSSKVWKPPCQPKSDPPAWPVKTTHSSAHSKQKSPKVQSKQRHHAATGSRAHAGRPDSPRNDPTHSTRQASPPVAHATARGWLYTARQCLRGTAEPSKLQSMSGTPTSHTPVHPPPPTPREKTAQASRAKASQGNPNASHKQLFPRPANSRQSKGKGHRGHHKEGRPPRFQ